MVPKAVVLCSGGLDSTTCLALAAASGYECHAVSFDYGQKQLAELEAIKRIAKQFDAEHYVFELPKMSFKQSALTEEHIKVPDYLDNHEIPVTYVPARNTVFLSMALGLAEVLGAQAIYIGVSSVDYSGYPDCRPEYIQAFENMANLATKAAVRGQKLSIHTPLMHLSKAQTIQLGHRLGVDYGQTVTCYQADEAGAACGHCDSCVLRKKGFEEAGISDPTRYV